MKYPHKKILVFSILVLLFSCAKLDPVRVNKVETGSASAITHSSASISGAVLENGDNGIDQHGFYYSTETDPTAGSYEKTELGAKNSRGSFSNNLEGLDQGTTYYFRAFAKNSDGEVYGDIKSFLTLTATLASLNTTEITDISETSAVGGGNVSDDGGSTVTARGVVWSTSENPTIADSHTTDGNGTGDYTSNITGLSCGATYYVRSYATNATGTAYGNQVTLTTSNCTFDPPTVSTTTITSISQTSAVGGGNVESNGGASVTTRGVCWSTSENPTITDSRSTDGNGTGEYTSSISGLTCGITYFVRAYATNANGTSYGNQVTFITSDCTSDPPTVTTAVISSITESNAQSGGNVTGDGGSAVTVKGVCWSTSPTPTISDSKTEDGNGTGSFTSVITGLTCGTTYYVRAYATNTSGTSYGNEEQFSTVVCPTGLPVVSTTTISNIQETSAMSGGSVTDDGGATVTAKGVVWSTSQNPTTADNSTSDGSGTGGYTSVISGLSCGLTYYVRAYATNSNGTSYGAQESFTTSDCPATKATVTTTVISNITENSAQSGGIVTDDGGAGVIGKGVVWSTSSNPTIADFNTTDGNGTGGFTSLMTDLNCGTTYYVRAYATNSAGVAYGNQLTFTTNVCPSVATVTTIVASNITETSAESGGNVTDDGGASVTAKGVVWSTSPTPTVSDNMTNDGIGTGGFTSLIDGLSCGITYYYRAYATNSSGTAYGDEYSLTTTACSNIATLTTTAISNIGDSDAWGGGNVTDDNGSWVTDKGVCWSTSPIPTISDSKTNDGSGPGSFTSHLTGLSSYTTYYVRAYATNSAGTAYGEQVSFKTSTVMDYEGNIYKTVVIGSQTWMAENLRVTRYSDGSAIPYINTDSDWNNLSNTQSAYSYYDNSSSNAVPYGALYTWPAIMNGESSGSGNPSGVQGVCPSGWHVPSDAEWKQLEMYIGMSQVDADDAAQSRGTVSGKLKEIGTTHWQSPNIGATNETDFTAIGSGWRSPAETQGQTFYKTRVAFYWTSTLRSDGRPWVRYIHFDITGISRYSDPQNSGMSVRCVKD